MTTIPKCQPVHAVCPLYVVICLFYFLLLLSAIPAYVFAAESRTIFVKILKVNSTCVICYDTYNDYKFNHLPDFYVIPKIERDSLTRTRTVSNNTTAVFNHTVAKMIPKSHKRVSIDLKLLDSDRIGRDDVADINPLRGKETLNLTYEPLTGLISGSDGARLGYRGQYITVKGNKHNHADSITFMVNHKDVTTKPKPIPKPKLPSCPPNIPNCKVK